MRKAFLMLTMSLSFMFFAVPAVGSYINEFNSATGNYYSLTLSAVVFQEARVEAEALGANLVTINDAAENTWVFETFGVLASPGRLWTGLTDEVNEGEFVWDSGQPVTYTNWNGGEPNGGTGENWVELIINSPLPSQNGFWNDNGFGALNWGVIESTNPIQAVPLPPTILLFGTGLVGLIVTNRRRFKKA